jgi:hypothetical protein
VETIAAQGSPPARLEAARRFVSSFMPALQRS